MFLISWFPHPKIQMVWSIFVFSNQDLSFSAFSLGSGFDLDLENEMVWLVAMVVIGGLIICSCSGFDLHCWRLDLVARFGFRVCQRLVWLLVYFLDLGRTWRTCSCGNNNNNKIDLRFVLIYILFFSLNFLSWLFFINLNAGVAFKNAKYNLLLLFY